MPATKPPNKKKKKRRGPDTQDVHKLYEMAVQCPEADVPIFDRIFKRLRGRVPRTLKEDFCGTALLCAEWVRTRPDNEAVGVDLDEPTLAWAKKNNIEPLGEDQRRVTLVHANVLDVSDPKVDIVAALNFSYSVFKTRAELRRYFENARQSLVADGVFILDLFGGWESQMVVKDRTRHKGFTYIWEQTRYSPVTHLTEFRIHFRFHDGGGIKNAFVYDWRLWTIPELRELLEEAGFASTDVYWEGSDPDTGEGNGEYYRIVDEENCPGWNALIVAAR